MFSMITPSSTYRVQLCKDFTFKHLDQIIDYLEVLGISTIYASPVFKAMKGSSHGYDVVNPHMINDEIGTMEELGALAEKLHQKGFSWIQDIVPNHMSFVGDNYRLWDVLERGKTSPYGNYFDIDWGHPQLTDKILLPFFEGDAKSCIENETLKLQFSEYGFDFRYNEKTYPINAESYELILANCELDAKDYDALLERYFTARNENYNTWQAHKKDLVEGLCGGLKERIERGVARINAEKKMLDQLALQQYYVVAHYETANWLINYRRFFVINDLICVHMKDEAVFMDYHTLVKELYDKGLIQGLRIDHIDGLQDPKMYIDWLRKLLGKDCYIIVEKILEIKEQLPKSFDMEGTSGYEFLSYINQVLTDKEGSEKLVSFYNQLAPAFANYYDLVFSRKISFLEKYMHGEWDNLTRLLLSSGIIDEPKTNADALQKALGVFMASFPIYRIYVDALPLDELSRKIVDDAFEDARKRFPDLMEPLRLLEKLFDEGDVLHVPQRLAFIQRLMQFTGPLAAKGVEDTIFYLYNPLISHNEVGDAPSVLSIPIHAFHQKMKQRQSLNPLSLNNTSSHDTKRGEDARVRINVLSEMADDWIGLFKQLQKINAPLKKQVNDLMAPVVNDEYFLYQSIIGGFPEDMDMNDKCVNRLKWFYEKALREAKFFSTPTRPDIEYEKACMDFIDGLFDPQHSFLQILVPFIKKVRSFADVYSLSQVIIKSTAPGIPDFYQGAELWDLSFVDPDNRRQVNYDLRKALMQELVEKEKERLSNAIYWAEEKKLQGSQKLFVTRTILQYRKANNALFIEGEYVPLNIAESNSKLIAYARRKDEKWLLVAIPTGLLAAQKQGWKEIKLQLPPQAPIKWKNIFTGETIVIHQEPEMDALFSQFPVVVLESVV